MLSNVSANIPACTSSSTAVLKLPRASSNSPISSLVLGGIKKPRLCIGASEIAVYTSYGAESATFWSVRVARIVLHVLLGLRTSHGYFSASLAMKSQMDSYQ